MILTKLGEIINITDHPYLMLGMIRVAARTNCNLGNAIGNSAHARFPNTSFRVIEFNRLIGKFVAKNVVRDFVKDQINQFLINNKYKVVEGVARKITKQFKRFFFK